VSGLTGLSRDRLRAWERRYEVVRPVRQANGYRAYTADQVALLRAYGRLIAAGGRIGDLVGRPATEVIERAWRELPDGTPLGPLLVPIRGLDREGLESVVAEQVAVRGLVGFVDDIVLPLATVIGDLWSVGDLPVAAEHLASEVIVHALKEGLRFHRSQGKGPLTLAACLPGERHEWGFLAMLCHLQAGGWQIGYLGADLPLEEVVQSAWRLTPAAIALSVSDPAICASVLDELVRLPPRLPAHCVVSIGGAGIAGRDLLLVGAGFRLEAPGSLPIVR
jgi:hypothetical protein